MSRGTCLSATGQATTFLSSPRSLTCLAVSLRDGLPPENRILSLIADPPIANKDPTMFYETAPRANVFRRDQHKVADLAAMKKIMRYNNWEHDPLALVRLFIALNYCNI
jgi:hypothetical protein